MAAVTREDWDTLDLMEIRRRAERLQTSLTTATLGGGVSLADFVVEKMLGKGANAYAFLARCRPGGKLGAHEDMLVVLKVVGRLKAVGATAEMLVQSAAAFRETVSHDTRKHFPEFRSNIVHVLGHFEDDVSDLPGYAAATAEIREFNDPNTAIIVLPFFSGGDLDGMIKQNARLPEPAILDILAQVADAVVKLQKPTAMSPTGVAHRDLKPDNIFFAGGKTELALADFGCVGPLQLPFIKNTTSPGGAQDYLGPEILARIVGMVDGAEAVLDYSKSDVYAIGMIGYAMCLGEAKASPWPEGIPPQALDVGVLKRIPAGVYSEGLRTLVEGLLSPKADQRMTAKEAHERCYMLRFGGAPVVVPVAPDAPVVAIDAEPEPEPEPEPDPPSDTTPQWEWQDTASGQWTPFGDGLALQIEVAHIAGVRSVDVNEEHPRMLRGSSTTSAEHEELGKPRGGQVEDPKGRGRHSPTCRRSTCGRSTCSRSTCSRSTCSRSTCSRRRLGASRPSSGRLHPREERWSRWLHHLWRSQSPGERPLLPCTDTTVPWSARVCEGGPRNLSVGAKALGRQ
jgi:serine/threonine protein kinase